MRKLLLLLWIVPFVGFGQGKTINTEGTNTLDGHDASYFLNTSSTSQTKSGQLTLSDSLLISNLATSDTKVLSPTSTGGTTSLETSDASDITFDTLTANVFMLNDVVGLSSATVDVTPAQIAALETTPIQLVAAQGANTIIEFVSAVFIWDYVDTDFTVTNADNKFRVQYDASTDVSEAIDMNTFLEGSADAIRWCLPANTTDTDLLALVNKKLELFNEGTGDVTGGTNSTLTVNITYRVHNTGL